MSKKPDYTWYLVKICCVCIISAVSLLSLKCGNSTEVSLSGGNTSEVSYAVRGTLYEAGGSRPAEHATVTIRPRNYIPGTVYEKLTKNPKVFFSQVSHTNSVGEFIFNDIPTGKYVIEGRNDRNECVFIDSVIVDSSSTSDTTDLPNDTLKQPCAITGTLDISSNPETTLFVYIPGLDAVDSCDENGVFLLTDLPEGNYYLHFVDISNAAAEEKKVQVITEAGKNTVVGETYHITYYGNSSDSGFVPVDTTEYLRGDSAVIMKNASLKRTGYTFIGWNTSSDGSGIDYISDTVIVMKPQNLQLFAIWKANQYRVTFDSRGGSAIPYLLVDYGTIITEPSVPVRDTMVFIGWFRDTSYSAEWFFSSDTVRTNLVLYAKWINRYEMKWIATKDKSFLMGEVGVADTVHTVNFFSDGYWIDSTEVTQSEYEAVMKAAYSGYRRPVWNFGAGPDFPVYNISWYDAVLYCNARTKVIGSIDTIYTYSTFTGTLGDTDCVLGAVLGLNMRSGFRLPTEAEWEFACRGGTSTRYFWGDDTLKTSDYAWYSGNCEQFRPVAQKSPNSFGLYDMIGNAFEICGDAFGIYSQGAVYEPTSPGPDTEANMKVCRGGSWQSTAGELGSANRGKVLIYEHKLINGFRVCRSIK